MDEATILKALEATARPVIEGLGGELYVSDTPRNTLIMLGQTPERFVVILQFGGDDAAIASGAATKQELKVVIQAAADWDISKGKDIYISRVSDKPAFLETVAAVRNLFRSLVFVNTVDGQNYRPADVDCKNLEYKSGRWLADPDQVLEDAREYVLTFTLLTSFEHVNPTLCVLSVTETP